MNEDRIVELGDELYQALRARRTLLPLTSREPDITIDDAYQVSTYLLRRRLDDGEVLIGKKIGVTSPAVQQALGVYQPDFGFLTDHMQCRADEAMPISRELIQPRAEGELAFRLCKDLRGPGVTNEDVLDATECVIPCFEVVDSRIAEWKIRIQDTVADNASCGLFVLGEGHADPKGLLLSNLRMIVRKNGVTTSEGFGSAALGSPLNCVRWLANTLSNYGIPLCAGEIVLSGSWVPLEPVLAGDVMELEIEAIGGAAVRFA